MITILILMATILISFLETCAKSDTQKARAVNAGMVLYGSLMCVFPLVEVLEPLPIKELILAWLLNSLYYGIVILLCRLVVVCSRE